MEEDKKIVEEILNGNTNRYGVLVNKYQHAIYSVVYRIVGNETDATELVQDVFIKAYEALGQYKPKYKFFSWMYRIAINTALMHVKARKKTTSIDELPIDASLADDEVDKEKRRRLLGKCINELPEKYKTVVVLKYYANFSYSQIAATVDLPEKKVKSRLFDGRKLLKDKLLKMNFFNLIS